MTRVRRAFAVAGVLAALAQAVPGAALAQPEAPSGPATVGDASGEDDVARARRMFFEGVAAEDARDYARAIDLYEEVRRRVVSAQLLFNLASCHEHLDHLLLARDLFEAAVVEADKRGSEDVAREARTRRERVTSRLPRLVFRRMPSAADAELTVDEKAVDPEAGPVFVDPGTHRVVARARDGKRRYELTARLEAGTTRTIDLDLDSPPPASGTPPLPPPQHRSFVVPLLLGGVAVALGATAVGTGVAGYADRDRYLELNATPTADNRSERERLESKGDTLYAVSAVFTTAFAVTAGLALYFALAKQTPASPTVTSPIGGTARGPAEHAWRLRSTPSSLCRR
ncbi:MAG: hypothetical protein JST00_31790 [Deltaproteobacteria bacterium]|nr:hypothetical protein [Deltaproteobacteria bacterium]